MQNKRKKQKEKDDINKSEEEKQLIEERDKVTFKEWDKEEDKKRQQ